VEREHEQVVHCRDEATGLRAIIAIHSTKLGPSVGGTRFYPFATEADALADVLRLSRAMTYKSAAAGLDLGGGKAVIIGDPRREKTDDLLRAYAKCVDSLGGRYITTEDVGVTSADMDVIATQTRFVAGTTNASGDPSEATAWGVFSAMRTLAKRLWGAETLDGRHVAIQGVGKVGSFLAGHLSENGCRLTVADVSAEAIERARNTYDAAVVGTDEIHAVECDIYAPCALAAALNVRTIPQLRCAAVIGCANNQLEEPADADRLAERGIVYGPDFIVNAGGIINVAHELRGYDREGAFAHAWRIGETLERVLDVAEAEGITTNDAANRVAEARLLG
jgi:leucine dehydrogenase